MKLLCVIEHGRAPSTRLRLTDCLEDYRQSGIEVTIVSARRSSIAERLNVLRQAARHDVIVLFKTLSFTGLELKLLQQINPRIVFDFDDAVMFRSQKYGQPLRGKDFRKFLRTMKHCAAAVAGNDYLACFAEACGRPAVVLPTSIDPAKYSVKKHSDGHGLTIGWLGLSDGLAYLRHIQPALRRLSARFPGLKLKIISDKPLQLDGVLVENETWRPETEQTGLMSFDIGIMPLWDSVWTRGKCGYKILQYMAAGIPPVASAVGANIDIITHGLNGFLARTDEEWVNSIASLIDDSALRERVALSGRELVEKNYSLESFTGGYIKLFQALAKRSNTELSFDRKPLASTIH
jgi:glycosyltransferase involved in cell wall biosynthesis